MAVSKRVRFEVLRRDNHTCRYCGATADDGPLTVDHVIPVSLGGSDDPSNLVAACRDCNAGKSSSSPDASLVADVAQDAVRWAAAMRQMTDTLLKDRRKRDSYAWCFDTAWDTWHYGPESDPMPIPRPAGWKSTIWRFYALGLPVEDVEDAVTVACGNERLRVDAVWRYFCGICWRRLDEISSGARALLETEE